MSSDHNPDVTDLAEDDDPIYRYQAVGKQVLLLGQHFADVKDEATAQWLVGVLHSFEYNHPSLAYTQERAQQSHKPPVVCLQCGYEPCRCSRD